MFPLFTRSCGYMSLLTVDCCCLHIIPFFLPNDISTPSVRMIVLHRPKVELYYAFSWNQLVLRKWC